MIKASAGSARLRCVHVIPSTDDAGAENQAFYMLRALRDLERLELELVLFERGRRHESFLELGIPCHQVERRGPSGVDMPRRARVLRRIYEDEPPALLHTWLFEANVLGLLGAQPWPRTAVIVSQRSGAMERGMPDRRRPMKLLGDRADQAIATSAEGAALLCDNGFDPATITVIHNGIPPDRVRVVESRERVRLRLDIAPRAPVIAYAGRVDSTKDLPNLFAAMKIVSERVPQAVLLMIGPSNQALAGAGLSPPRSAISVGWQAHPADLMNCADVVAISSLTEGYANVAGEALCLGLPVATTATGDHPALVRELGGKVVPVRNPTRLAEAILSLLTCPPARDQIASAARSRLRLDVAVRATLKVYEQALGSRRPGEAPTLT